jgi:hypothetical protein
VGRVGSDRNIPLMTVRTLAISCMILYLTLLSLSWPKPRWYVAGARPTGYALVLFVSHEPRYGGVWLAAALQFLPGGIWLELGCKGEMSGRGHNILRARKRSSEGMQMALRRRTVTGEGRVSCAAGGGWDRGGWVHGETVL